MEWQMKTKKQVKMGWMLVGLLAIQIFSAPAWGLDLDQEIKKQNQEAEITLDSMERAPDATLGKPAHGELEVQMIPVKKPKHKAARSRAMSLKRDIG
jgi:hypothetical protein